MKNNVRESGIELLRIICICGVIVLHYNGSFAMKLVTPNSANHYLLLLLESVFICAVDLFVLISGYYLCTTNSRKAVKITDMLIQVVVFGILSYIVSCHICHTYPSMTSLAKSAIPNNYYVTLYLMLYFLSPYINIALHKLTDKQLGFLVMSCFVLLAVWPTVLDFKFLLTGTVRNGLYTISSNGSQYGYSLLNFSLMYLIGTYLRRKDNTGKIWVNLLGAAVCIGAIFVLQQYCSTAALSYCNPFVIMLAVFYFRLFKAMHFRSVLVNTLAKGTFTVFLFHNVFLFRVRIHEFVNRNILVLMGHIAASVVSIFLIGWIAWQIYDPLSKPLSRFLGKKLRKVDALLSPPLEQVQEPPQQGD